MLQFCFSFLDSHWCWAFENFIYCFFVCLLFRNVYSNHLPMEKIRLLHIVELFSELLIYYWYVTDINPLSHGWLTIIFFHSEICIFFLLFSLLSRHCLVWHNLIYQFPVLHPVCFGFYHYLSNILKCFLCNINIRLKIIWKTSCIHDPITPSYHNHLGPSPQHLLTLFVEYHLFKLQ